MNQLEQTENNRPFAKANLDGRAEPVMGRDEFVVQVFCLHTRTRTRAPAHLHTCTRMSTSVFTTAGLISCKRP